MASPLTGFPQRRREFLGSFRFLDSLDVRVTHLSQLAVTKLRRRTRSQTFSVTML
jgi:hypothetical protein